ncbi:MAG: hypothetical protein WBA84_01930 [Carnobacterium sp.]|uniref:hypothetical protein n=1 Tax=Carnobacterium sp. TaxID=48221 RepID=UPI003C726D67
MSDFIIGIIGISIISIIVITILFGLVKLELWVYNDANRRNMKGSFWIFFVFITLFVPGILVYLAIRKSASRFKYNRFKKNSF